MFSHPAVTDVMTWGFWEGTALEARGRSSRRDWSTKPNGQAWMDLVLREWWTDERGRTDNRGAYRVRGFLGVYQIEVATAGAVQTVSAGAAARGDDGGGRVGRPPASGGAPAVWRPR